MMLPKDELSFHYVAVGFVRYRSISSASHDRLINSDGDKMMHKGKGNDHKPNPGAPCTSAPRDTCGYTSSADP